MRNLKAFILACLLTLLFIQGRAEASKGYNLESMAGRLQFKSFKTIESLEDYIHSFGYISSHLKITSIKRHDRDHTPSGVVYYDIYFSVPEKSLSFQGQKTGEEDYSSLVFGDDLPIFMVSGLNSEQSATNALVKKCQEYVSKCSITPKTNWIFTENTSSHTSEWYKRFILSYQDKDHNLNNAKVNLFKNIAWGCTPPIPDKPPFLYAGLPQYGLADNSSNGTCTDYISHGYARASHSITIDKQDTSNLCSQIADPIVPNSGELVERKVDYTLKSAQPIIIKRIYTSQSKKWLFWFQKTLTPQGDHYIFTDPLWGAITLYKIANIDWYSMSGLYHLTIQDNNLILDTPKKVKLIFNKEGRLTEERFLNNHYIKIQDNPTSIILNNNFGNKITLEKLGENITSVIIPNGNLIRYTYDNQSNLSFVNYPNNSSIQYKYNSSNLLTRAINSSDKKISTWTYDAQGKTKTNMINQ
ncbi:hypothetical protein [Piscirickettsia litoralis]|uniref:RHS repeat protein n=1 Tax=Piscirickettsia litoralis TaxID=1891921 RepID=A0ABX2ZXW1_9GAMM|nr:hypothetical protein [Piscirickettsia litoralis]ODN41417.1 hypothetical protein BGC07_16775 [Piscirickettsia litoralis]